MQKHHDTNPSNGDYRDNKNSGSYNRGGKNKKVNLPKGYLEGGYFRDPEKKEKLKPEYIVEYPKELAQAFEKEHNSANKRTQIRKYYDYLLGIEKKMGNSNGDFSIVEAYLLELVPKVTYATDRGVVTEIFQQFIEKNVAAVEDEKDLKAFVKHFESVIAFTKRDR